VADCFPKDIKMDESGKAFIRNRACIACGHCVAICPVNAVTCDHLDMQEVVEYDAAAFDIAPENLMNFIHFRRTIRNFKDLPLTKDQIMRIIDAGRFTQTGGNLQDVSFIVVQEKLDTLKDLIFESLNEAAKFFIQEVEEGKRESSGYAKLWLKMYEAYRIDPVANDRLFFNAPAIIVVVSNSQVNGALASSNMELMINAMGLGTMFSGFFKRASLMNPKIADFLGVADFNNIVTCMVVGYPNVTYQRTVPRNKPNVSWL
jgi:nitroreductase